MLNLLKKGFAIIFILFEVALLVMFSLSLGKSIGVYKMLQNREAIYYDKGTIEDIQSYESLNISVMTYTGEIKILECDLIDIYKKSIGDEVSYVWSKDNNFNCTFDYYQRMVVYPFLFGGSFLLLFFIAFLVFLNYRDKVIYGDMEVEEEMVYE